MRDLNRWKDKVELQLDGRQIFFLFFGSAVCACLLFVLGVVVGKRMEARVVAQARDPVEDPLAVLDELGNAEEGFTFHNALAQTAKKGKKDGAKDAAKDAPAAKAEAPKEKAEEPTVAAVPAGEDEAPADKAQKGEPKGEAKKPLLAAVAPKPAPAPKPDSAQRSGAPSIDKAPPAPVKPGPGHFTLQLSAFATRSEAADLMKRLREQGYKPFLAETQVPGKGLMFRVRLGDYVSREGALSAKTDFERKQKMVAYVAKL